MVCTDPLFLRLANVGEAKLGFASDIELMLVYGAKAIRQVRRLISNSDYFDELLRDVRKVNPGPENGIFNIDLQLRPYGKAGSLAVSLEAFTVILSPRGRHGNTNARPWSSFVPLQAMMVFGRNVSQLRDDYVYNGQPFDITAMRAMRERKSAICDRRDNQR